MVHVKKYSAYSHWDGPQDSRLVDEKIIINHDQVPPPPHKTRAVQSKLTKLLTLNYNADLFSFKLWRIRGLVKLKKSKKRRKLGLARPHPSTTPL